MAETPPLSTDPIEFFISKWQASEASERANYQMFLTELCDVIGVPHPNPSGSDNEFNSYVFDRSITRKKHDGSSTTVWADLYKRGCFMLETKQGSYKKENPSEQLALIDLSQSAKRGHGVRGTHQWDIALEKAHKQAQDYIRDLSASEGRPPFLMVCDVGYVIELYSEFTCTGGTYVRFPDPQHYRIYLEDLRNPEIRERLKTIWTDPLSLDPSKHAAKVTREVADHLARLARSLDEDGHDPETVATFLQRCLFTMFAEDIGLLPENAFTQKLVQLKDYPEGFPITITSLWREMASDSEWSTVLMQKIAYFNGGLFENATALPLNSQQIALLIGSAKPDWADVEPAIFGTLLERALNPQDRHKLGAHYTPRSYVERLVKPTIIDPLREKWDNVRKAAAQYLKTGEDAKAREEVRNYHRYLCQVRVLDPACGSGNFLYVTLEHMKRLEGEVLELLKSIGDTELTFEMQEFKVRPQQFWGMEINQRAVAIAQLVLWIGYFQWHKKTTGTADTHDRPLLPKQQTILHKDAVLEYDRKGFRLDENGQPITIWDGRTTKPHPVTQKEVPDETARIPVYDYINPRRPEWPEADFIVGNPPFIGASRMRDALGDGYTESLRKTWKGEVPESADFVMFWWDKAAQLLRCGKIQRFGFITTNSIHQTFNRRVLEKHMNTEKNPLSIVYAIPDHPWVDTVDGAAVRIAMTVGVERADIMSELVVSESEHEDSDGEYRVDFSCATGRLNSKLQIGADLVSCSTLKANENISNHGVIRGGDGFLVSYDKALKLGLLFRENIRKHLRPILNGRDITERFRNLYVIDLYGLSEDEVLERFPEIYQHILSEVKPKRLQNKRRIRKENWWLFNESVPKLRDMLKDLKFYFSTVETTKHRVFVVKDHHILPEHKLVNIALSEIFFLAVLSSAIHVSWTLKIGSQLGPTPVYVKTLCFETFPFPDLSNNDTLRTKLDELGEQLDAHRKRQQAAHLELTMTGMYNVLEKLRKEEPLTDKDRVIHEQGLVSVLKQIHDDIDMAVLEAYGWMDLTSGNRKPIADRIAQGDEDLEQAILGRLVDLNHERAEEEKRGLIRWLRPEYQNPEGKQLEVAGEQEELDVDTESSQSQTGRADRPRSAADSIAQWPATLSERIAVIKSLLPVIGPDAEKLSSQFSKKKAPKRISEIAEILDTLRNFGQL